MLARAAAEESMSSGIEQGKTTKDRVGDRSGGGTPGPIPNPAVKPASADGSMWVTACESRSSPTLSLRRFHLSRMSLGAHRYARVA